MARQLLAHAATLLVLLLALLLAPWQAAAMQHRPLQPQGGPATEQGRGLSLLQQAEGHAGEVPQESLLQAGEAAKAEREGDASEGSREKGAAAAAALQQGGAAAVALQKGAAAEVSLQQGAAAEVSLQQGAAAEAALQQGAAAAVSLQQGSWPHLPDRQASAVAKAAKKDILLFWAVGAQDRVIYLVAKDIRLAREQWGDRVDVFLAHYDLRADAWRERLGDGWYAENVDFSAERAGYKFQLMQQLLVGGQVQLEDYRWVWALDEDVLFQPSSLRQLLPLADASQALVLTPAFTQPNGTLFYPLQQPDSHCLYRYSSFVEVLMPLLRSDAAKLILTRCDGCIHEHSVWGLDWTWCSWTARQLHKPKTSSCAILDDAPMVHLNYRSLTHKYEEDGSVNETWWNASIEENRAMHDRYPNDYLNDWSDIRSYWCVPKAFWAHTRA